MAVTLQHGIGKTKTTDTIDSGVLITFITLSLNVNYPVKSLLRKEMETKRKTIQIQFSSQR